MSYEGIVNLTQEETKVAKSHALSESSGRALRRPLSGGDMKSELSGGSIDRATLLIDVPAGA